MTMAMMGRVALEAALENGGRWKPCAGPAAKIAPEPRGERTKGPKGL